MESSAESADSDISPPPKRTKADGRARSPDGVLCTSGVKDCRCLTGRTRPIDKVRRSTGEVLATYCSMTDCIKKNKKQNKDSVMNQCNKRRSHHDHPDYTFRYHSSVGQFANSPGRLKKKKVDWIDPVTGEVRSTYDSATAAGTFHGLGALRISSVCNGDQADVEGKVRAHPPTRATLSLPTPTHPPAHLPPSAHPPAHPRIR